MNAPAIKLKSHDRAKAFSLELSNSDYHARPELSNSGLNKLIEHSPGHYKYWKENPPEQTKSLEIGSATHEALLEPEKFLESHIAMPECDRRTKAGKDFYEKFMIEQHGKTVLDAATYAQVQGMIKSVMAHTMASAILKNNHNEMSFFGELQGVKVRCRPDILRQGNLLADLKTTDDASFRGFQRSFANFNYHRQAAFYCDIVSQITGEKYDTFTIIAVEKKPPYAVQVFAIDEASIEKGREEYEIGLAKYRECLLTDKWPLYADEVVPLNLPSWKF